MVRVLLEQFANAAAVLFKLFLKRHELPGDGDPGAPGAFGGGDRRGAAKLIGPRENLQAFLVGFGPLQAVLAKELVPAPSPGSRQLFGRGELHDEGPSGRHGPIIEGFAGRGEVLVDRLLQLVDQRGARLDEGDLVATEQSQFLDEWIFGLEPSPSIPVESQRVGERPGIDPGAPGLSLTPEGALR